MALRLCRVGFNRPTKVQVNDSVKTRSSGEEMILLELGNIESFGKDHWVGVVAPHIVNIKLIKKNIDNLETIGCKARLEWFKDNFPRADVVKIDASQIADKVKGEMKDNMGQPPAVSINSIAEVVWKE